MNFKEIIEKLNHVQLSISAHPDSQPDSEMADCVDTLSEVIQHLKAHLSDSPTALLHNILRASNASVMNYPGFKKEIITDKEYSMLQAFDLFPIGTITDPEGTILDSSIVGELRAETTWGKGYEDPVIGVKYQGGEKTYYQYTPS